MRWGKRETKFLHPDGVRDFTVMTLPDRQSQWKSTFPAGKPLLRIPIRGDPPAPLWFLSWYHFMRSGSRHSRGLHRGHQLLVALRWRVHCPLLHIDMSIWHLFPRSLSPALKRWLSHLQVWSGVKEDEEAKWHGCHLRWASCRWHVHTRQWCPACPSQCTGTGVRAEHRGSDDRTECCHQRLATHWKM